MNIATTWAENVLLNKKKKLHKPFVADSLSTCFVHTFALIQQTTHSSPWRSTECVLCLQFGTKKTNTLPPPQPPQLAVLPSPSKLVSAPRTGTQRSRILNKYEASLEQCPCFSAQRDALLLCNNTHILIDCVPNNYSVKKRGTISNCNTNRKVLLETGSYSTSLYLESV